MEVKTEICYFINKNGTSEKMLSKYIPIKTRGILYICDFDSLNLYLKVQQAILFEDSFGALNAYSNIPNPASQVVLAKTYNELIKKLEILHKNIEDKNWLEELSNCI